MITELAFHTFRYFIVCYFYKEKEYADLVNVITRFKELEYQENTEQLLREAKEILKLDAWEEIHNYIYQYTFRDLPRDSIIQMLWIIISTLS